MKITRNLVESYLEKGLITARKHNDYENLVIINYTLKTTFEKLWDDFTIMARGLVFDMETETVLSSPFRKFFNLGENMETLAYFESDKPYEILDKLDGSLGISYYYDGKVRWTTRGDFHSKQAIKAQEIWDKYPEAQISYDKEFTLLTEIVYPENKVIVDYGEKEELVLLAVRHIGDGTELEYHHLKALAETFEMPVAKRYFYTKQELLQLQETMSSNEEGFVLRYEDGFRLKIKSREYIATQKLLFGLSEKSFIETWMAGYSMQLLASIPEEFRKDYKDTQIRLEVHKARLKAELDYYYEIFSKLPRKDLGLSKEVDRKLKAPLFFMLDKQNEKAEQKIRDIVGLEAISKIQVV